MNQTGVQGDLSTWSRGVGLAIEGFFVYRGLEDRGCYPYTGYLGQIGVHEVGEDVSGGVCA
jgi:hypothetical protein